jgi:N-formylglutamate amidohydrolase
MASKDLFPQAYEISPPASWHAPALFNSPHSGRAYPKAFLDATRLDPVSIRKSEDCFVDELFAPAVRFGAPLLKMHVPRAYIDVNREPYELDPRMFEGELPAFANAASVRVSGGLGTIPRIVCEGEEIYRAPLRIADAMDRIETIYRPYHRTLAAMMDKARRVFGAALLVDCHSMPASAVAAGPAAADIVLGDRHGAACGADIAALAEDLFRSRGFRVLRNKPYAGGFITQNYSSPGFGRHVLQIEINRALYLNERTMEKTKGFAPLAQSLEGILGLFLAGLEDIFAPVRLAAE